MSLAMSSDEVEWVLGWIGVGLIALGMVVGAGFTVACCVVLLVLKLMEGP